MNCPSPSLGVVIFLSLLFFNGPGGLTNAQAREPETRMLPYETQKDLAALKKACDSDAEAVSCLGLGRHCEAIANGMPGPDCDIWFLKAAFLGDADAQIHMSQKYMREGRKREGMELLMQAANRGNTKAMTTLGLFYSQGEGAEKDLVKSSMWLELAAERGNEAALKIKEALGRKLTEQQMRESRRLVAQWKSEAGPERSLASEPSGEKTPR